MPAPSHTGYHSAIRALRVPGPLWNFAWRLRVRGKAQSRAGTRELLRADHDKALASATWFEMGSGMQPAAAGEPQSGPVTVAGRGSVRRNWRTLASRVEVRTGVAWP